MRCTPNGAAGASRNQESRRACRACAGREGGGKGGVGVGRRGGSKEKIARAAQEENATVFLLQALRLAPNSKPKRKKETKSQSRSTRAKKERKNIRRAASPAAHECADTQRHRPWNR
ncbi:hypothetical protein B0H13DRAFT_1903828 [Mycena leptocephala]|nr:hypothetical protein B0H13DRAFT_1903828 [Mycena leptocephala]